MNPIALFIRHKAKPGQRDAMREIWEHYVKPRAAANPGHLEYFFCYDIKDLTLLLSFSSITIKRQWMSFSQALGIQNT